MLLNKLRPPHEAAFPPCAFLNPRYVQSLALTLTILEAKDYNYIFLTIPHILSVRQKMLQRFKQHNIELMFQLLSKHDPALRNVAPTRVNIAKSLKLRVSCTCSVFLESSSKGPLNLRTFDAHEQRRRRTTNVPGIHFLLRAQLSAPQLALGECARFSSAWKFPASLCDCGSPAGPAACD